MKAFLILLLFINVAKISEAQICPDGGPGTCAHCDSVHPAPSCNLTGPLIACLHGGLDTIQATIDFSGPTDSLIYSFQVNTANADIVDTNFVSFIDSEYIENIIVFPGTNAGAINLQLDVYIRYPDGCIMHCECSKSITIINVTPSVSFAPIACFGGSTTLTATGAGATSYSYLVNPGGFSNTTGIFPGLTAGTYTINVAGTKNFVTCDSSITTTITQPPAVTSSCGVDNNLSCHGSCNGTAHASGGGGTPPYTYLWSNGQTTSTASALCAQSYTVTVSDANGCTTTCSVTPTQPPALSCNSAVDNNISCNSLCNGTAHVTGSGGTPPYSYLWSNGQTTSGASSLCALTYTVTVTDAHGCSTTACSVTPTQPSALSAASSSGNIACNGGSTTVTVTASGGTPAYSGTGSFTRTAGTYTFVVTDAHGCTASTSITITQPPVLSAASSSGNISCNGGSTTVTVTASGGTPAYSGTGTFTRTAGTYSFVVTDANGCTASTSITITQPTVLSANSSSGNISCNGGSTTVTVTASGGTAPYSGTGSFTRTAGSYSFVVTDANGCTASTSITITQPTALSAASSSGNISCNGGSTTVTVTASGGTAPYSGTGSFTRTAGTYTFVVTDNNGCTASTSITITQPTALSATSSSGSISCNGGSTTVTVTASGGTPAYSGTGTFTRSAGTYSFVVTDANGCTASTSITITQPTALSISATPGSTACNGGNATVNVSASGGTAPYSGTGTFTRTAGSYSFCVTDANGCTACTSVTVSQPTPLSASSTSGNISCNGGSTTVTVTATGGTTPYSGTGTFTCTAGSYSFVVTDANGCTASTSITITQPTAVSAASSSGSISCNGGSTTVTVTASGGTAPYSGTGTFTRTAGTYSFVITDANGCTASTSITITQPTVLSANSGSGNISCYGGSTTVTVTASGGTAPYSSTGTFTETAGSYSFVVTDSHGCTASTSITITQPSALSMSANANPIPCNGTTTTVTVTASGGTSPYSGTGTLTRSAGSYTFTVTDANGCTAASAVTITQPPSLTINIGSTPIPCNGGNTIITVTAAGCQPPYSGTGTFTRSAGTYTFCITDANGATACGSITVTQPAVLTVGSISGGSIGCNGGSANLCAPAGYSTYVWNTGGTTSCITASSSGSYSVTVTNANGCPASTSTTVTVSNPPACNICITTCLLNHTHCTCSLNHTHCNGVNCTLNHTHCQCTQNHVHCGFSTASCSSSHSHCYCTLYHTHCTSANCTLNHTHCQCHLNHQHCYTPCCSNNNVFCSGGSVMLNASGGTSYVWSNGSTKSAITVTSTGNYMVTVTNSGGCTSTCNQTLTVGSTPSCSISPTTCHLNHQHCTCSLNHTHCTSANCTLNHTHCQCNLNHVHCFFSTATCLENHNHCTCSLYHTHCTSVNCTLNHTHCKCTQNHVHCYTASCTGTAFCAGGSETLIASGGTSFLWSNGATTSAITVTTGGTYMVTVGNGSGCSSSCSEVVTVNPAPSCSISISTCQLNHTHCTCSLNHQHCTSANCTLNHTHCQCTQNHVHCYFSTSTCQENHSHCYCTLSHTHCTSANCTLNHTHCQCNRNHVHCYTASCTSNSFCSGGSETLIACGGSSFLWSNGAQTAATTVTASGTYYVTVTNGSGCTSSCSQTVTVNSPPSCTISGNLRISYGGCTTLCGPSGYASYNWSTGANTCCITVRCAGTYYLTVTNSSGCSCTSSVCVTQSCYRLDEQGTGDSTNGFQVTAYPNPFSSNLSIEFQRGDKATHTLVELYSFDGSKVAVLFDDETQAGVVYKTDFNVDRSFANGIYIYRITSGDEFYYGKVILQK